MFYEDFVPGFVARIKDLKTCRKLRQKRGDQMGVEKCNRNIQEVRETWRKFHETATKNREELISTGGDEIVWPTEETYYSDEDEDLNGAVGVREEDEEELLSAAEEENLYSSGEEFSPAEGDEEDSSDSEEEPSADEEFQNNEKNVKVTKSKANHETDTKSKAKNETDTKSDTKSKAKNERVMKSKAKNESDTKSDTKSKANEAVEKSKAKNARVTKSKAKNETDTRSRTPAKASNKRIKIPCPLPTCDAKVVHVPRHLRNVHGWHQEKARVALQQFNLRKTKPVNTGGKRKRDYHVKKKCPMPGCSSVTKRIADHLTDYHEMKRDSKEYKKALKYAMKAPEGEHVFKKLKRARLEREQMMNEVMKPEINDDSCGAPSDPMIDNLYDQRRQEERIEMLQDVTEGDQESQEADEIMESDETEERQDRSDDTQAAFTTQILNSFQTWLRSPDGGKKDGKTASQHMKQLRKVLSFISPDLELSTLFDYKLIRDKFITDYAEKTYYPKTIKSYIMSVRHFYTYMISEELPEIKIDKALLISARERLQRWSVSYKKECNKHQWEKREEDLTRIVTPAMVVEFEGSQAARDAIILIGKLSDATSSVSISQRDFTLVRDFLMTQISIDNAKRAGVLANMTFREFRAARFQDDGETCVVRVMEHKTVDSKGPASVVLSKKLHSWLDVYLKHLRPRVCDNREVMQLFVSWNGKSLESNQIAKALKSVFKKAEMDVKISSNDFRKGASSEVHDKHKGMSSSLAVLLDHTETAAQRYYRLTDKAETSVKASKQLAIAMRGSKPIVDPEGDDEQEGPTIQENKAAAKWDKASEEALQRVFAQQIQEQAIAVSCVREKIVGVEELENREARDVLQKIRSQWRFPRRESASPINDEVQLPSVTETVNQRVDRLFDDTTSASVISPSSRASCANGVFSSLDVELVIELCADMLDSAPISKKVITQRLQNNDEGKKLFAKVSINQLVNRIKYERKMRRERSSSSSK